MPGENRCLSLAERNHVVRVTPGAFHPGRAGDHPGHPSGGVVTEVGGALQAPPGGIRVRAPGSAAGEDVVIRTVPGSAVSGP